MSQDLDDILEVKSEGESPQETTSESSTTQATQPAGEGSPALVFAALFYLLAVGLAIAGFVVAYQDSNYANSIVGGDAYNYIIFAGRGMTWMGAAIAATVLGLGCQLAGYTSRLEHLLDRTKAKEAV